MTDTETDLVLFKGLSAEKFIEALKRESKLCEAVTMEPEQLDRDELKDDPNGARVVLPWTITAGFLEDMPKEMDALRLIEDMMIIQAANDVEDLLVNGDSHSKDLLLRAMDGLVRRTPMPRSEGGSLEDQLRFLIDTRPENEDADDYVLLVSYDTEMDLINLLSSRDGEEADRLLAEGPPLLKVDSTRLVALPYMEEGVVLYLRPSDFIVKVSDVTSEPVTVTDVPVMKAVWDKKKKATVRIPTGEDYTEYRVTANILIHTTFEPVHAAALRLNG